MSQKQPPRKQPQLTGCNLFGKHPQILITSQATGGLLVYLQLLRRGVKALSLIRSVTWHPKMKQSEQKIDPNVSKM
jgi:hypothetical protein